MNFDKICILFHVTIYYSKDTEYFHHLKKIPSSPFYSQSPPSTPRPQQSMIYFLSPQFFFEVS